MNNIQSWIIDVHFMYNRKPLLVSIIYNKLHGDQTSHAVQVKPYSGGKLMVTVSSQSIGSYWAHTSHVEWAHASRRTGRPIEA